MVGRGGSLRRARPARPARRGEADRIGPPACLSFYPPAGRDAARRSGERQAGGAGRPACCLPVICFSLHGFGFHRGGMRPRRSTRPGGEAGRCDALRLPLREEDEQHCYAMLRCATLRCCRQGMPARLLGSPGPRRGDATLRHAAVGDGPRYCCRRGRRVVAAPRRGGLSVYVGGTHYKRFGKSIYSSSL